MRVVLACSLCLLLAGPMLAVAQEPVKGPARPKAAPESENRTGRKETQTTTQSQTPAPATPAWPTPREQDLSQREAVVLPFVREHHPELAELLEQLKAMKPEQYTKAINELWQVTRTLANYRKNDPRRYQAALEVWKARSRAELIAAQLVGSSSTELEGQLRGALKTQLEAEIRQQRLERELVKERLRKLDEEIDRMESRGEQIVESRYQVLLRRGPRGRRQEAGRATPSAPASQKGEPE